MVVGVRRWWSRKRTARQHGGGRGSGGRGSGGGRCAEVVEEAVVEEAVVEEAVVEVCDTPHLDKGEVAPDVEKYMVAPTIFRTAKNSTLTLLKINHNLRTEADL